MSTQGGTSAAPGLAVSLYLRVAAIGFPVALAALGWVGWVKLMAPPTVDTATPGPARAPRDGDTPRPSTSQAFEDVYKKSFWGKNADGAGNSGSGSTLSATVVYRAYLQAFLKEHDIHSVVDAGCGDWEFSSAIDWTGIDYKGYDIVAEVIEKNRKRYTAPNVSFHVGNIAEVDLPKADLILSKHVLQHLSNRDVAAFLKQLPKYKHALLTNGVRTDTMSATNTDIHASEYRPLDPTQPPFSVDGTKALTYWDSLHMHQVVHVERR